VPLPHVVAAFGVLATVTLAGSVSVKATPLSATAFAACCDRHGEDRRAADGVGVG